MSYRPARTLPYWLTALTPSAALASLWLPADPSLEVNISGKTPESLIGVFAGDDIDHPLLTFSGAAYLKFIHNGNEWEISDGQQTVKLENSQTFQLGWYANGVWITDVDSAVNSENDNQLQLNFSDTPSHQETLIISNIKPILPVANPRTDIPAPYLAFPIWILLGGFLAFLAMSKYRRGRKQKRNENQAGKSG